MNNRNELNSILRRNGMKPLGEKFTEDKHSKNVPNGMFWTSSDTYSFTFTNGKKVPIRFAFRKNEISKLANEKTMEDISKKALSVMKKNEGKIWDEAKKYLKEIGESIGKESVLSEPEIDEITICKAWDYEEWVVDIVFYMESIKEHGYVVYVRLSDSMVIHETYNGAGTASFPPIKKKTSLSKLKENFFKKVELAALAESSDRLRGPIPELSERIVKIKTDIVDLITRAESVDAEDIMAAKNIEDRKDLIMNDIKSVADALNKSDQSLNDHYKETLSNSILTLMTTNDEVKSKDIIETPSKEIIDKDKEEIEEIKTINPEVGKVVEKEYPEVEEAIKDEERDLVYDPSTKVGLVPAGERPSGESYRPYGEANKMSPLEVTSKIVGIAGGIASAAGLIGSLVAVAMNVMGDKKNKDKEAKYGSALNIQQPLIASDDLSSSVISSYAKYLETSTAIEAKQALESSLARKDGGNIVSRSKHVLKNTFTNANKKDRSGKTIDRDADEVLSSFRQCGAIMDSITKVMVRNPIATDLIYNIQSMVSKGESGEFVDDNKHSPKSTIQVELTYNDPGTLIPFGGTKPVNKKSTLTVDVSGRKLPYEDIVKAFLDMNTKYFSNVKVTPQERNTDKVLKNSIEMVDRFGTPTEKSAVHNNKFSNIIAKIKDIGTPLFHLMISQQAYNDMKNRGLDIKNPDTYKKILSRLPLISIAIANEDNEILSFSMGQYASYRDINFKDIENEISKYEKELQSMIKFGMQR